MLLPIETKEKARLLRLKGYSFQEISDLLDIAKSTCSLWLRSIKLTEVAKKRLETRSKMGCVKAMQVLKKKRDIVLKKIENEVVALISRIKCGKDIKKLLCAFLYWAEGEKDKSTVVFVNSNKLMIMSFLKLFRESFTTDNKKMRALVHIHEYHNDNEIKEYWSRVTNIPLNQFNKSYLKPHTKKRIRENYKGTISIRYHDYRIAHELKMVYNIFASSLKD